MTQDEIMRMAREAGLQPYYDEQVTAIARFAAIVAATEREKCTNTQEFVTLTREAVEQALETLEGTTDFIRDDHHVWAAVTDLRQALERPQVEHEAEDAACRCEPSDWYPPADYDSDGSVDALARRAANKQPQANQPAMTPIAQRKLDDLVASGYTISGYSIYHEQKHQHGFVTGAGLVGWWKPEGVEYPQPLGKQEPVRVFFPRHTPQHGKDWVIDPAFLRRVLHSIEPYTPCEFTPNQEQIESVLLALEVIPSNIYTSPKPKREPLTNEQVKVGLIQSIECTDARERCAFNIGVRFAERAHNIK